MTLLRLLWGVSARALGLSLGLGVITLAGVQGVERAELLDLGPGPWLMELLLRSPLLARDLLPLLLGVGLALCLGRLRERDELLALQVAGVSASRLRALLVGIVAVWGLVLALGLELVSPAARDALLRRDAATGGQSWERDGAWVRLPDGVLRARGEAGGLRDLTLLRWSPEGDLQRLELSSLSPEGEHPEQGWVASAGRLVALRGQGIEAQSLSPEQTLALLPDPQTLTRMARALAPSEQGLLELWQDPTPEARAWRAQRLCGLLLPGALALPLLSLLLRRPWGVPRAVGASAALLLVWQLVAVLALGSAGAGWAPLALALALGLLWGAPDQPSISSK